MSEKNTVDVTEGAGLPASGSGRSVQESSEEVRQNEMGITGTRETTLAALSGAAPVVDRAKAAKDEAKRQAADDARRKAFHEAEAKVAEAVEKAREAATKGIPQHEGI